MFRPLLHHHNLLGSPRQLSKNHHGGGDAFVAKIAGPPLIGIGVFRPSTQRFEVDYNGNRVFNGCVIDRCWGPLGVATNKPMVGDWMGDGKAKMGIFRPSTQRWYLDGDGIFEGCAVDLCRGPFGVATDQPVVGASLPSPLDARAGGHPETGFADTLLTQFVELHGALRQHLPFVFL